MITSARLRGDADEEPGTATALAEAQQALNAET
jgi:hypothetical protein